MCMYMTRFPLLETMPNHYIIYIAYLNKSVLLAADIYQKTKHFFFVLKRGFIRFHELSYLSG